MSTFAVTFGRLLQVMLFVLTFTLEVRVKAATVRLEEAEEILQEPKSCLLSSTACALKTLRGERYKLEMGSSIITMDQLSTVVRVSTKEVRLIAGTLWVKIDKHPLLIKTEFGEARVTEGEAWVSRSVDRMIISAIDHDIEITPRGGQESMVVEPGFENYLSRVGDDGVAETGLPVAISFRDHLDRWSRLFDGKKQDFEKQVAEFHERWLKASEQSASVHRLLLYRKVASIESERARQEEARRKVQLRDQAIRELFRKKILEDL